MLTRAANALCLFVLMSFAQHAFPFQPQADIRDVEWSSWPDFCKASYILTDYSAGSTYRARMSRETAKRIANSYGGEKYIPGAHHFCVGVVLLQRVQFGTGGPQKRGEWAGLATNEFFYTYKQMEPGVGAFGLVSDYYARALRATGSKRRAYEIWQIAISFDPSDKRSYVSMSAALLEDGKKTDALELLQRYTEADAAAHGDYQFALASALFENGKFDDAKAHVTQAMNLGYNAAGLLRKIEKSMK